MNAPKKTWPETRDRAIDQFAANQAREIAAIRMRAAAASFVVELEARALLDPTRRLTDLERVAIAYFDAAEEASGAPPVAKACAGCMRTYSAEEFAAIPLEEEETEEHAKMSDRRGAIRFRRCGCGVLLAEVPGAPLPIRPVR